MDQSEKKQITSSNTVGGESRKGLDVLLVKLIPSGFPETKLPSLCLPYRRNGNAQLTGIRYVLHMTNQGFISGISI